MKRLCTLLAALCCTPPAHADEAIDYLRQIKPILSGRCYACHGALKQRGGLRLDTGALVRKGGDSGPAVVPGKADQSLLVERVSSADPAFRMPPQGEPLGAREIALLKEWINRGAPSPAGEKAEEDPRKHWAFRPLIRPPLPAVRNADWVRNPIDAFIAAAHDQHGLRPAPPALKHVLLRRVYLDLIGLPPTREELHAFLADDSPDAYEKVVDRLLASPAYGERWARHWMDVWRYSDWYGRRAVPDVWNSAPQIWRWRDWIVQSLNADKGYDRMVLEMLAADEIAPEDDTAQAATGYIVRNWYALNPNQWMRDLVEHTGKAFLGLTLNCAHCHDHKYDPISQEEYFRFRAFFEPLQLRQDRVPGEPDPGPFQKYEYSVLRKVVPHGLIRVFDEKLDAKTYFYTGGDERNRVEGKPPLAPAAPAFLGGERLPIEPVELPPAAWYPGLKPFIQEEEFQKRALAVAAARAAWAKADAEKRKPAERRLEAAAAELQALQARITADRARFGTAGGDAPALARAASKAERRAAWLSAAVKVMEAEQALEAARQKAASAPAGKEQEQAKAAAGKAEQQLAAAKKAHEAAARTLDLESDKYTPLSPVYPDRSTGRRKALAEWIVRRDNPLAARVAINHMWMRHFDRPLVESVFDFGRNGKPPSHPELLDWLAVELMESGWSMKHLHRLIVTSNTYRQASGVRGQESEADRDNRWLWQFRARRVEAEVLRDGILHAAGELDRRIGGPVLEVKEEATSRRRSLYFSVYPEGGGSLRFLELFDAPDPCDCYRRSVSIVPQQALALTNSRLLLDQSRLLARKLPAEDEEAFIVAAFEQLLSRRPTAQELATCREFLAKQAALFRAAPPPGKSSEASVPPSADPQLRARESLVRALFSHEEFVTIR